jgi:hypothetical protein
LKHTSKQLIENHINLISKRNKKIKLKQLTLNIHFQNMSMRIWSFERAKRIDLKKIIRSILDMGLTPIGPFYSTMVLRLKGISISMFGYLWKWINIFHSFQMYLTKLWKRSLRFCVSSKSTIIVSIQIWWSFYGWSTGHFMERSLFNKFSQYLTSRSK